MSAAVIPVTGGRFECPHCGRGWVGTWHGDPDLMTCIVCERPMARAAVEEDARPGKPETPGNSGTAGEEDTTP